MARVISASGKETACYDSRRPDPLKRDPRLRIRACSLSIRHGGARQGSDTNNQCPDGSPKADKCFATWLVVRDSLRWYRFRVLCLNRRLLCAHDQDPEHECYFSYPQGCAEGEGPILVSWEEEPGKAKPEIPEATQHQPQSKKARDESRPVHEQPEWDQPDTPEDPIGQVEDVVQPEEQHHESFVLRL